MSLSIIVLILVGVLITHIIIVSSKGRVLSDEEVELSAQEMKKYMLWKSFYVNPDDPRGWVPKTYGIGLTINFRTNQQVYIFVGLICSIVVFALLMLMFALRIL